MFTLRAWVNPHMCSDIYVQNKSKYGFFFPLNLSYRHVVIVVGCFMKQVYTYLMLQNDYDRQYDRYFGEACQSSRGVGGGEDQWTRRREEKDREPAVQDAATVSTHETWSVPNGPLLIFCY